MVFHKPLIRSYGIRGGLLTSHISVFNHIKKTPHGVSDSNQPTNPTPSNHDGKHLPHSVARSESHQGVIDVVQAAAYLGQAVVFLYKVRGP